MATTQKPSIADEVIDALRRREPIHRLLPAGGELRIDRALPFLLVYRRSLSGPEEVWEDRSVESLLAGEAVYLIGGRGDASATSELVSELSDAGSREFGAFLVLEVWEAEGGSSFEIRAPKGPAPEVVSTLEESLARLGSGYPPLGVEVVVTDDRQPAGMPPLLSVRESWGKGVLVLGLTIPPVYRQPKTGEVYPAYLRRLRDELSAAIRHAAYEFIRVQTRYSVDSYQALGTRALREQAFEIDRELSELERAANFLILTSPVNDKAAWERFKSTGYDEVPEFHYRLLPMDPDLQKRRLYALPMEEIGDPAIESIFQDKRRELDLLLSMLNERGSDGFRFGSMRLYGAGDDRLYDAAKEILERVTLNTGARTEPLIDARGFHAAAERELDLYREQFPGLANRVEIRPDLSELMVAEGNLLIGSDLQIAPERLAPLIHHEVGTHVLTYANGAAQPLEQLSLGLAGYDELQEGLAVFAEYLVDGLNALRMRLLAIRVIAARSVEQGADFVETFRILNKDFNYTPYSAWRIALRVHQSGGFTRDQIYLRGLLWLLDYLHEGGDLEPLYVGKIAPPHISIMGELRARGVLEEPPLTPRFLHLPETRDRLRAAREGLHPVDLISEL